MKNYCSIFLFLLITISAYSQVGIGTTNPDASSVLDVVSTTKGFLTPRLTTVERDAINSPAEGLLIYNTTDKCLQTFKGVAWSGCLGNPAAAVKSLVCAPPAVSDGVFVAGTALETTNTINVTVTTTAAASYFITTNSVNGYSFSATGILPNAGTHTVTLAGVGTPVLVQTDTFTISMAGTGATCTVDVDVLLVAPPIYANCKELQTAGFVADGVYSIDTDGAGGNPAFDCYCDMTTDGGGWTLVFRHDTTGGFFANDGEADSFNVASPGLATNKYSILNEIDALKSAAAYEFRLLYPDISVKNHWTQVFNPRSGASGTSPVAGYTAISIDASGNFWGGLERSTAPQTFLDGSVNHGNWWYAIGTNTAFGIGMPGPSPSITVTKVELYIR